MQIFDFFSREEMAAAPADPQDAFVHLVDLAYQRLSERVRPLGNDEDWDQKNEARHGFMNVVVGLAKAYRVEPIASMQVPTVRAYGDPDYRQFKTDLDHFLVQLLGRQVKEEREESVALAAPTKEKLLSYLHHIKIWIDGADLTEARRATLLEKLAEFEAALNKNRLSLAKLMKFVMAFGMTGLALSDSQTLHKILDKVVETVAEVHAIEDEQRKLPPIRAPLALIPPRPLKGPRESFAADLDDEIPF